MFLSPPIWTRAIFDVMPPTARNTLVVNPRLLFHCFYQLANVLASLLSYLPALGLLACDLVGLPAFAALPTVSSCLLLPACLVRCRRSPAYLITCLSACLIAWTISLPSPPITPDSDETRA